MGKRFKEEKDREAAIENAKKKQQILDILAEKRDDSLKNKSEEELMELLDSIK